MTFPLVGNLFEILLHIGIREFIINRNSGQSGMTEKIRVFE